MATADGRLVYRLPDASYPAAWVDHDSSLLAIGADGRGVHLERWAMADLETDAADAADAPDAPVHGA
ncbi:MAG TPA: hypothetical protein VFI47_19345 [Acidimicrobiales bacterium]|nr:hypothetical protein [Acidimicrobiales bacterium]